VVTSAKLKYLGVSAQKTRWVVDQVRGKNVGDALALLHYAPQLVARDLEKLVKSALANAQQKDPDVDVDNLVLARAVVDEAPPLKRSRHQSMGRVFPVTKRACHVTVGLDLQSKAARR